MFECPVPEPVSDRIQMAHGGGGRLMNDLIRSVFLNAFGTPSGGVQNDAAVLDFPPGRLIALWCSLWSFREGASVPWRCTAR